MLMAAMSILRLVAASMSDAEWLLLFQPASPSRVLLLMESQSQSSLASRDELVWRSPQWLQNSPESKLKWRLRMARPSLHSAATMSMWPTFRRQPPLVSQMFSEALWAAELLPLSFLRGPFLLPADRRCFPSRDQPRH